MTARDTQTERKKSVVAVRKGEMARKDEEEKEEEEEKERRRQDQEDANKRKTQHNCPRPRFESGCARVF